ncbi:uncharacterized protein [Miscanthus floridulus]|uniref:uncharacterized protein n=1 Tax=Miscanthus floridulus TaxID=154761 RepID=UPI00345ACC86
MSSSPSKKKAEKGDGPSEKKEDPSPSPQRRRGRSHSRRSRTRDVGSRVIERIVERPSTNVAWPMLTRTNYPEWALVMEVNFQTLRVWDVVIDGIDDDPDDGDYHDDRVVMAGLLRSVPPELWNALAVRRTAKEAWDAVKILRIGDERARDASAHQLCRDFGNLSFKEGETVNDFGVRITTIATNLCTLGDNISESEVVKKMLQVVPEKLSQAAVSIEMFCDLNSISIEDVIDRLQVFKDRGKQKSVTDAMGRLLLTEEDWEARRKARRDQDRTGRGNASSSGGKKRSGRGQGCGRGKGEGGGLARRDGKQAEGNSGKATNCDQCKRCGKYGHWAKDCRSKPKAEAHVVQAEEDSEPTLLMARATLVPNWSSPPLVAATTPPPKRRPLRIVEGKVFAKLDGDAERDDGVWYLDSGATNHMSGSRNAFINIDTAVRGFVKFGDGSEVAIEGSVKVHLPPTWVLVY